MFFKYKFGKSQTNVHLLSLFSSSVLSFLYAFIYGSTPLSFAAPPPSYLADGVSTAPPPDRRNTSTTWKNQKSFFVSTFSGSTKLLLACSLHYLCAIKSLNSL